MPIPHLHVREVASHLGVAKDSVCQWIGLCPQGWALPDILVPTRFIPAVLIRR